MRYRFPYIGADLRKLVHHPGIQRTLQDHGYGLLNHAICLPSPATHSSLTTEGRPGRVGLGAWFCARVVYPSKDGHPLQALTRLVLTLCGLALRSTRMTRPRVQRTSP